MPTYINPQAAGQNFYNPYAANYNQYGVQQMPISNDNGLGETLSTTGQIAGYMGPIGAIIGAGLNFAGSYIQNENQKAMYEQYQSPQARMRQMVAAGINPNTAAAGIAGSAPPAMQAATIGDMSE